jgi:hypothetical protein
MLSPLPYYAFTGQLVNVKMVKKSEIVIIEAAGSRRVPKIVSKGQSKLHSPRPTKTSYLQGDEDPQHVRPANLPTQCRLMLLTWDMS